MASYLDVELDEAQVQSRTGWIRDRSSGGVFKGFKSSLSKTRYSRQDVTLSNWSSTEEVGEALAVLSGIF